MCGVKPARLAGAAQHRRAGAARRALDPRLARQVGEPQVALARERVVGRERQVQRVVEQVHALDGVVRGRHAVGAERQRELELAGLEPRHDVVGLGERQRQLDGRVALLERRRSRAASAWRRPTRTTPCAGARRAGRRSPRAPTRPRRGCPRIASVWRTSAGRRRSGRMPRTLRSTSVVPASRSSAAICCETADCVNESASAAAGERAVLGDRPEPPACGDVEHQRSLLPGPIQPSFELMGPVLQIGIHSSPPSSVPPPWPPPPPSPPPPPPARPEAGWQIWTGSGSSTSSGARPTSRSASSSRPCRRSSRGGRASRSRARRCWRSSPGGGARRRCARTRRQLLSCLASASC